MRFCLSVGVCVCLCVVFIFVFTPFCDCFAALLLLFVFLVDETDFCVLFRVVNSCFPLLHFVFLCKYQCVSRYFVCFENGENLSVFLSRFQGANFFQCVL